MFIIILLHHIVIGANLLVFLRLSTIVAGFIFSQSLSRQELYVYMPNKFGLSTSTCLWTALECPYVYCSNGIHMPKHDAHITCLLHKAWRCTGIFTQRTPKLQLHVHSSGFQARVCYPPIG